MRQHRAAFTAISYQFYGICGAGSNAAGGSMDCTAADAVGVPHFARAHPTTVDEHLPAQLRRIFPEKELWPMIAYGNPGNSSVLNDLVDSPKATDVFIQDAIAAAHANNASGYNFDIECFPGVVGKAAGDLSPNYPAFLKRFAHAMHAATPPIAVSYDGLPPDSAGVRHPIAPEAPMDRWISMATYTSNLTSFTTTVAQGLNISGSRFGIGLCPDCWFPATPSAAEVKALFDVIAQHGSKVRELDLWAVAYRDGQNRSAVQRDSWRLFWEQSRKWLAAAAKPSI